MDVLDLQTYFCQPHDKHVGSMSYTRLLLHLAPHRYDMYMMGLYMVSKQTDIILGLVLSADKIHRFLGQESLYAMQAIVKHSILYRESRRKTLRCALFLGMRDIN
jgi:hypothetical protein